jgi:predicted transposase/invertase (TIGR01784 family)
VAEKIDRVLELPPKLGAWTNFYYYSHLKSEAEMTTLLQGHPMVQQAYGQYLQFNQDEKLRALDEAHQRFLHDMATDIEEAREGGRSEGIEIGLDSRNIEIARNLRDKGCEPGFIAEITGLSSAEIDQIG